MVPVYYGPQYVLARHSFDTTRKAAWIALSLDANPIAKITLVEPRSCEIDLLLKVHSLAYVDAVRTGQPEDMAQSQGFNWDAGLWTMVLASNGGLVDAALAALNCGVAGSLSSGLHHAQRTHGKGFCTFNGLVIAAQAALDAGCDSVLILDFDAHCGGGTASLIASRPAIIQLDISVSEFDFYPSTPNATLVLVDHADRYLAAISSALDLASAINPRPRLCLYNAGMDPFEDCLTGGLPGITANILAERERMVFSWAKAQRIPIAFALAGGYISPKLPSELLVQLHRSTIAEAARLV